MRLTPESCDGVLGWRGARGCCHAAREVDAYSVVDAAGNAPAAIDTSTGPLSAADALRLGSTGGAVTVSELLDATRDMPAPNGASVGEVPPLCVRDRARYRRRRPGRPKQLSSKLSAEEVEAPLLTHARMLPPAGSSRAGADTGASGRAFDRVMPLAKNCCK